MTNKGQHSNEMALNDIYFKITALKFGQLQWDMEIECGYQFFDFLP